MKLVYFNLRGVVEVSRYMLHMGGAEYEDFRYPFDTSNWAKPEADAAKIEGKHDINMGRLPFLEVDGQLVAQSKSIERFVATRFGFYGANDVEAAQIDCVCEHVRDIKDAYQKVRGIQDKAEKKAGMEKWFGTDLPEWCGKLEKVWQFWCARPAAAESAHTHASSTRTLCVRIHTHVSMCMRWLWFFRTHVRPVRAEQALTVTPVALVNGIFPHPPTPPVTEDNLDNPGCGGRK